MLKFRVTQKFDGQENKIFISKFTKFSWIATESTLINRDDQNHKKIILA